MTRLSADPFKRGARMQKRCRRMRTDAASSTSGSRAAPRCGSTTDGSATARTASARAGGLAGVVLALSEDPSSTRVWERGSVGERKLAAALGIIDRDDVIFLHDRRVPHTRGNIDHIVVAPSGVYVVDAKR
jgi:Nuclease-related domain